MKKYMNAVKRWFNVIAADLNDDKVSANGAVIFDSLAGVRESRYFEREVELEEQNNGNGDDA